MLTTILSILVLFASVSVVLAGPFGINMGDKLEDLDVSIGDKHIVSLASVPKPHPSLKYYIITQHPDLGVCKIAAITGDVESSVFGEGVRIAFNELVSQISIKYGKYDEFDFVKAGSRYAQDKYFMASLVKGERVLYAVWTKGDGATLSDHVHSVSVEASADRRDVGEIKVTFEFENIEECIGKIKADRASVF